MKPLDAVALEAELPGSLSFAGRPGRRDLAALPSHPALFLLTNEAGAPVLLATALHLRQAMQRRLEQAEEPGRRTDLGAVVRGVRWRPACCGFELRWQYYRLARRLYPREYRRLVGFPRAWFLSADWDAQVPEIRVTERVWNVAGEFIGAWPARSGAQQALTGLCDLFDLCRYPEQVRRTPKGCRCAYADMGRCDAPCDGSVPLAGYVGRMRAAWRFAGGQVAPWIDDALAGMRAAAARQSYEQAALLKSQLAFADHWRRHWLPHLRRAHEMNFLIVLPVARRRAWKLFLFRAGALEEGPLLGRRELESQAPAWLAQRREAEPTERDSVVRMEQTWLFVHLQGHREADGGLIQALDSDEAAMAAALRSLEAKSARRCEPDESQIDGHAPPPES
jgi:excinuclease UvrABC nuclease subunit